MYSEWLPPDRTPREQLAQDVKDALRAGDAGRALRAYDAWLSDFYDLATEVAQLSIANEIEPFLAERRYDDGV